MAPTAAETAKGSGVGITDSKEALFGVGWHGTQHGGALARGATMRSTAAFSSRRGDGAQRQVFYETRDGTFLQRDEFRRQLEAERKRDAALKESQEAIKGFLSVGDDDAKSYDGMVAYATRKTRHLNRLLATLCTGVSLALVLLFLVGPDGTDDAFFERLAVALATPAPSATPDGATTAPNATTAAPSVSEGVIASPFGGECTVGPRKCFALFLYAGMYRPLGYFFLVASLLGCLFGLMPFAHEASLAAPHRAASKRLAMLERAAVDPASDPRTRARAEEQLASMGPRESRLVILIRYFLNPQFVPALASWACTVAVMSVEHDRRRSQALTAIDDARYNRLVYAIFARAVANAFGLLVALSTSSDAPLHAVEQLS
eukprot:CAMPEP_0174844514 /NCGR_PEP_ID=MMETSP1114-20130205/11141_1 /TAXON_ID=312471 /ORGANISM="Neobodo designis, Strain CCAP 1951/1" /LENGTH=374 /DNA_ID=CAMNT_0016078751 /DNA_START=62 /DNA_END=1186 /DNA_ORIENTATION=+